MLHFVAKAESGNTGGTRTAGSFSKSQIGTIRANASKMASGAKSTIKYSSARAEKGKSTVYKGRAKRTRG